MAGRESSSGSSSRILRNRWRKLKQKGEKEEKNPRQERALSGLGRMQRPNPAGPMADMHDRGGKNWVKLMEWNEFHWKKK
ncbi:hypothetical protein RIB2604_00301180 [Aspergillus luchuensis]|uniref:Uncharacterized protein n=1 Tax=Aspergillus kawachii TaxID=1069201 RepID=A0A146EYE0_ASPKA|nr:hypothetical protein RIB2604_00301180 [Aspergillus luchuensis]